MLMMLGGISPPCPRWKPLWPPARTCERDELRQNFIPTASETT